MLARARDLECGASSVTIKRLFELCSRVRSRTTTSHVIIDPVDAKCS